ncbi:hypothetical protein V6N13_086242 [Hibiscus sabdariffa]
MNWPADDRPVSVESKPPMLSVLSFGFGVFSAMPLQSTKSFRLDKSSQECGGFDSREVGSPLSQFVWFGLVCKDWHTTTIDDHLLRRQVLEGCHRQVPLLMIPTKDKSPERRGLYNIIHKKTYHTELSVPYSRRCCGSSYGWIATVDHTSAVKLINPFTNGIIDLPPIDTSVV